MLESSRDLFSVRSGKWKYINGQGSGGFSGRNDRTNFAIDPVSGGFAENDDATTVEAEPSAQLYDMAVDPGETTNLYRQHPDIVEQLDHLLQEDLAQGYWKSS